MAVRSQPTGALCGAAGCSRLTRSHRYYYDCVRLHSEKENLLVPIHAYPVMNEVVFPRRIDFGVCPLSETATRTVVLRCKVPIQFEYELEVVEYVELDAACTRV